MKKITSLILASVMTLAAIGTADAAQRRVRRAPPPPVVQDAYIGPFRVGNPRVFVSGVVVGGASLGAYYAIKHNRALKVAGDGAHFSTGAFALTTVGCMTLAPMLAAALVWNAEGRYLTSQEAIGLNAGCIIPFIGPLLVDAAYKAHPEWPR